MTYFLLAILKKYDEFQKKNKEFVFFYLFKVNISFKFFGDNRNRTDDSMLAKHLFYQLNYTPLKLFIILDPKQNRTAIKRFAIYYINHYVIWSK